MQINFHQKGFSLNEAQKDYVTAKIEALNIFKAMQDPSVVVKVDVEFMEKVSQAEKFSMAVTANIPGPNLRAEVQCLSVEEGIDLLESKLRAQLAKHKELHG